MAKRLTEEDILRIKELYSKLGTYAAVARETGFSPSTVKKYAVEIVVIDSSYKVDVADFQCILPPISQITIPKTKKEWSEWCSLTKEEEIEILEFSRKLVI